MQIFFWKILWINRLNINPTKWSNTQTIRLEKPTSFLIVFDHFVGWRLMD